MKSNLVIGILKETRSTSECRAPLTPKDVALLIKKGIEVEVESDAKRIFDDSAYKKAGAKIVKELKGASIIVGIKNPALKKIMRDKIYLLFSHTIKGQKENIPFLKKMLSCNCTLIDYEKIVNSAGKREVYFGRFAGICGAIDSLFYFGRKTAAQGIKNSFEKLKPAHKYSSLAEVNCYLS